MTTPAWGTAPAPDEDFTVFGFFAANGQRFAEHFTAVDARAAEDAAQEKYGQQIGAEGQLCDLKVCAVVGGHVRSLDAYAYYLDPDAPAPEESDQ